MNRLLRALVLGAILGASNAAQAEPVLVAADLRTSVNLSGPWHYSIDPYRSGLAGFHGERPDASQQRWRDVDVRAEMAQDSRVLYEFDLAHSPMAMLPSSWLTQTPELRYYQGLIWYQRVFKLPARPAAGGGRKFLRFGAANYKTVVYLNGQAVGRHEGGFTPFAFEVTQLLREGDNQITVGVDSQATPATVPPPVTDWENYGGMTRSVLLVCTPATYVDDAWVRLTRDGQLAVDAHLDGPQAANSAVRLRIAELGLELAGTSDARGDWHARMAVPHELARWSPERPKLYDVVLDAGEDHWQDRIGFRTIETRGADILLNGKPIFLRGISLHEEEIGPNPTRNMTPEAARALLSEVKNGLHGNFVRLAHYPHSEVMTRMADEMGLLVWSEVPVYWLVAWSNPQTLATARDMLAENIRRDRNRASIAIWSVANETPLSEARNTFLRTLVSDVRGLDDSRLVSAALLVERDAKASVPTMRMTDPLAQLLDVIAINTYNGWYTPDRLADLPRSVWQLPVNVPLIFSEFGADAKAGLQDLRAAPSKFSEQFQAEYYRKTLEMMDRVPTLRGMSPWILKDFRSPRRQNPDFQQGWNRKGLISETGQRKAAFGVLGAYYEKKVSQAQRPAATTASERAAAEQLALDAVVAAACNRQLVLLGEASHGDGHTEAVKARLVERLVGECGFNAVLFESSVYEFMPVARAVRSAQPVQPAQVAAAVGGLWAYDQELQPLLTKLAALTSARQLTLGGIDFQVGGVGQVYANDSMIGELTEGLPVQRRDACRSLFHSRVYGADAPQGMSQRARSEALQACVAVAASTPMDGADADTQAERRLAMTNVADWLSQLDQSPSAFVRARDHAMAANVERFLDGPGRAAKIVVWTHNAHAAKDARALGADYAGASNLVAQLAQRLGSRLFALGVTARSGAYRWSRSAEKPVPAPPPDALEARFDGGTSRSTVLIDAAQLHAAGARPAGLIGHVYTTASWASAFDAVLVLDVEHAPHALRR